MRIGKNSFMFNKCFLEECSAIVGPKEQKGPLGYYFDYGFDDLHMHKDSWEHAEVALLDMALEVLFKKVQYTDKDIDMVICGDLINQNAITNYTLRNYDISVIGIYGACSTAILGMINAALIIEGGNAKRIISAASSHYADSERQYRNPTEYGGPKPNTQTSTVNGASATLISHDGKIKITKATLGKIIDIGCNNPFDMGGAMAPAAYKTIKQHFLDFELKPDYYDLILTGDLSSVGVPALREMLMGDGYDISKNHEDAGLLIYDLTDDTIYAGGSGCACIGVVSMGYVVSKIKKGELKRVLLCGTGALLNPTIINQNETIPAICHCIALEGE